MRTISKVGLGISACAVALAFAPAADAAVFHIGDIPNFYITSGTPFSPSITANFGNGFSSAMSFDDFYEFTIPTQSGFGSGSISTSFSSPLNMLVISTLKINGVSYTVPSNGSGQSLSLSGIPITAGVLNTIEVAGMSGPLGGTYTGTATFSASAVPEPATWGMMILGFGLLGAAVRRRRTSVSFA